jgi:hypothetical protein
VDFKSTVEATPGLAGAWRNGLHALAPRDGKHVAAQDTRALTGSVNVDSALKGQYPNDPRWDYGIGHQDRLVFWIEIHPASGGEVKVVLAKLQWLKNWLKSNAKGLNAMPKAFIWISSGKTSFTLDAPQRKRFALLGLEHKGRRFTIPANVPKA